MHLTRFESLGDSSVVSFEHGLVEGRTVKGQLLLRRFDFGWQTIDIALPAFRMADLEGHGISVGNAALLLGVNPGRGNPSRHFCSADFAKSNDVTAVRKLMLSRPDEAIGGIEIASGYAVAYWWGNGGGADVFAQQSGTWRRLAGGGGVIDAAVLEKLGAPPATAKSIVRQRLRCA